MLYKTSIGEHNSTETVMQQQRTSDTTQQIVPDSAYPVFSALSDLPKVEFEQEDKDKNDKTPAQPYRVTRQPAPSTNLNYYNGRLATRSATKKKKRRRRCCRRSKQADRECCDICGTWLCCTRCDSCDGCGSCGSCGSF